MIGIWLCCCAILAMLIELLLGNYGLAVPMLAMATFYLTVVLGWRAVFAPVLVVGSMLDLTLAHRFPTCLVLLPAVMWLARFWHRHGDCRDPLSQAVPGALLGLIVGTGRVGLECLLAERWGIWLLWHNLWLIAQTALAGSAVLPALCMGLDAMARNMDLPLYELSQKGADEMEID